MFQQISMSKLATNFYWAPLLPYKQEDIFSSLDIYYQLEGKKQTKIKQKTTYGTPLKLSEISLIC